MDANKQYQYKDSDIRGRTVLVKTVCWTRLQHHVIDKWRIGEDGVYWGKKTPVSI